MAKASKPTKPAPKKPSGRTPKGTRGGARPGAGHPVKQTTLEKREFERIVHGLLAPEIPRLIANLLKLADGVKIQDKEQVENDDIQGEVAEIFTTPPDREANKYLLDRLLGKPRESIEHSGSEGAPIPLSVEHAITRIYGDEEKSQDGPDSGPLQIQAHAEPD